MKNILVIGASTGIKSINRTLAKYSADLLSDCNLTHINISDYNTTPIFSVEYKDENGTPAEIIELTKLFAATDGFIISFAEHNGSFTAGYKNIIDWISTQGKEMFNHKPMLLMSASPGPRGGENVLNCAANYYPFMGGKISGTFSFPSFFDNFNDNTIINNELNDKLKLALAKFKSEI